MNWKTFNKRIEIAEKLVRNIKTLDVGSGDGKFISHLINPSNVVAADIHKPFLKNNPSRKKVFCDIRELPFKSNSFKQITCFEVIEHVKTKEDRIRIIREMYRVLEKGGNLILSTPNRERLSTYLRRIIRKPRKYPIRMTDYGVEHIGIHFFEYSLKELEKELQNIGFKDITINTYIIQIPFLNIFFNVKSKFGLALFTKALKE